MSEPSLLQHWQPMRQQTVFRHLLDVFSYPGRIAQLDAGPDGALCALLATLVDTGVTLADPDTLLDASAMTLLASSEAPPDEARFVLARGAQAPTFAPFPGTLGSPETGATLVLLVERLGAGSTIRLQGPGCDGEVHLPVRGLHPAWLEARAQWNGAFPLGFDVILVDGLRIAALPRTCDVVVDGEGGTWAM